MGQVLCVLLHEGVWLVKWVNTRTQGSPLDECIILMYCLFYILEAPETFETKAAPLPVSWTHLGSPGSGL